MSETGGGFQPLVECLKSLDLKAFIQLLDKTGYDVNATFNGESLLVWALILENPEALSELIRRGADPNIPLADGSTALTACSSTEEARELLAAGAMLSKEKPVDGETSLHKACLAGNFQLVKLLMESCSEDYRKILLHSSNSLGETPLHCAVKSDSTEIVGLLCEFGADVNHIDSEILGDSALYLAIDRGHKKVAQALIDLGANLNVHFTTNESPTELARQKMPQLLTGGTPRVG